MEILTEIQGRLKWVGLDRERNEKNFIRLLTFLTVTSTILTDQILSLVYQWRMFWVRIESLKWIVFFTLFTLYPVCNVLCWDRLTSALSILEAGKTDDGLTTKYRNRLDRELFQLNGTIMKLITVYSVFIIAFPLGKLVVYGSTVGFKDLSWEEMPLPYTTYFPPGFATLWGYIFAYSVYVVFVSFGTTYQYLTMVMPMNLMRVLANEIKSLRSAVVEFDRGSPSPSRGYDNLELKHWVRFFVESHKTVYTKHRLVNQGCQALLFVYQLLIAFNICLPLYALAQAERFKSNILEVLKLSIGVSGLFLFNYCADRIIQEEDNLRNTLYSCNWFDKPAWFKRDLLMIIMRHSRASEMKPYGLFVMNLRNFAVTMNAAFSYFNLLNNV